MSDAFDPQAYVVQRSLELGLDPEISLKQFGVESSWDPKAVSPKGALGYAQLMPETATAMGVDRNDPKQNIEGGLLYMRSLMDQYDDDHVKALAAYNAGPGAVDKHKGVPPFPETQRYVEKILGTESKREVNATTLPLGEFVQPPESAGMFFRNLLGTTVTEPLKSSGIGQYEMYKALTPDVTETSTPAEIRHAAMMSQIMPKLTKPEDTQAYQAGDIVQKTAEKIFPVSPEGQQSFAGQFLGGAGSLTGFVGALTTLPGLNVAALGQGLPAKIKSFLEKPAVADAATAGVLGMLNAQATGYDAARATGKSVDESLRISMAHGKVGALMGVPVSRGFSAMNKALGGNASSILGHALQTGIEFPVFMGTLQVLDNAVAKMNYDEKRELFQGVLESVPSNAALGVLFGGLSAWGGQLKKAEFERKAKELYDELEALRTEPGGKEEVAPAAPTVPAAPTPAPVDRRADFEKALQKEHSNIGSASGAVAHWKKEGFDVRYERDPQTGKYFLVENEKTPEAPTFADEFRQNEEATAGEGLVDPYKTAEVLSDAMERDIQEKMAATGLPRHKFDLMTPAPEAKKAKKKETPPAPAEEPPPPPSGKPITKGEEVRSEAEQLAIDDRIVELREDKKKSFVEISKTVGLSMAETKARYKYATGKSEKAPYEVGGTEEEAPREAPVIQTELPTELPRGTEAPKEKEAPPPTKALPTKVTKSASGEPFRSSFQARGALADLREKGLIAPEKGNIEQIPGTQFWQIDTKKGGVSLFSLPLFAAKNDRWFSKLHEAVSTDYSNWPKKMNGADALQRLQKIVQQGKAKKEEYDDVMRLTGLKQRLEAMKGATRDQILDEIMSSGIEVEERWYGDIAEESRNRMLDKLDTLEPGSPEHYELNERLSRLQPKYENTSNYNLSGPREGYVELVLWSPQAGEMREDPGHFMEGPGKRQIGWVRGDWRRDAEGKKVFFIEEVQEKRVTAAREARAKEIERLMQPHKTNELRPEVKQQINEMLVEATRIEENPPEDSAASNYAQKIAWHQGKLNQIYAEAGLDPENTTIGQYNRLPEITRHFISEVEKQIHALEIYRDRAIAHDPHMEQARRLRSDASRLIENSDSYVYEPGLSKEEAEKKVPKDFGYAGIHIAKQISDRITATRARRTQIAQQLDEIWKRGEDDATLNDEYRQVNTELRDLTEELSRHMEGRDKIPDAPFRDSWLRLISRAVLKYAAENGADKVAWTTGEQQAERWSLRQVADEMMYRTPGEFSEGVLKGWKNGSLAFERNVFPEELPSYVGVDLAKELIRSFDEEGKRVQVPEGYEFYSSKWPEKIYGFARGGYEKSLLATAMKEAMGQFKRKVGEIAPKRKAFDPALDQLYLDLMNETNPTKRAEIQQQIADSKELPMTEHRLTEFSRQPAVEITPEAREFWTNNPMALYTFSPFTFKKRNIGETRNVLFTNLGKEGEPLTEILRGYVTDDISRLTKIASLTQWLVEENPRLRPIFETVMSRLETAQTLLHSYLDPWAKDYTALPKESQEALTSFFVGMDERSYKDVLDAAGNVLKKGMGVEAPKYLSVQGSKKGMLQLNPEHYEQWKNAVRAEGNLPEDLIDLAAQMRKSMDQALIDMWNLDRGFFKPGSAGLKTLKNAVYEIDNYFPHIRQGDWVLEALEIDHKTGKLGEKPLVSYAFNLLPGMFDVQKWAGRGEEPPPWIEKWAKNKFAKEVNENPFTAGKDHIWRIKRHAADPVQMYGSQPILVMALQDMVNRAATSQQAGFSQQYANVLNKSLADVLKKTGEWGHFAHRSGIPGHDVSDVGKVFYNYFSGFSNIRAKAHMVKDLAELARQIDVNRPQETAWAAKYMDHMLDPNRDVSALMHGLRQLAYYNYLNPARFFFVNLTNAITAGSPTLGVHTGIGTADKYLLKSISRTAAWQAGRGTEFKRGNAPDTDLVRLMKELYDDGTTRAQFLETIGQELMQEPGSGKMRQYYEGAKNVLSWPAKTSEILSRVATAMAAFDAYRDGKVKGTEKIDGTMSEEQFQEAKAFAADIVDKSHSIWSEVNRPEWARGSGAGRLASSALIFKHYQQHVLQMWKWMWDQGPQGKAALGRSILSQFLLGGLVGIPLAQTLRSFYQSMFDEDPWIQAKKGTGGFLGDWFFYGAPASMGLPIHTSFETDLPMKFEDLLGVPASLVRQSQEAIKSAKLHDWQRAAENAIPVKIVRDILQGQRLYSRGATTSGGQPIGTLERPTEPQKIGLGELAMKTLGFPPMSVTKLRDVRAVEQSLQEKRQAMEQELGTHYVNALRAQDQAGMAAVMEEANAWNQKYLARRQPQYVIRLKDAIQSRMRPALPPKAMRGTAREMEKVWLK